MIDPIHLAKYIIRPVLKDLDLYSEKAERLILGTACTESECGRWLKQLESGPAGGIYQSERPPLIDNVRLLNKRPELKAKAEHWIVARLEEAAINAIHAELVGNLYAATVMCRIHYLRFPEPIPDNLPAQAQYWKTFYNSEKGAGTVEGYIAAWKRFIPATAEWV